MLLVSYLKRRREKCVEKILKKGHRWGGDDEGSKENKRDGEKLSPDVTAVLQPLRVNLGLTFPSHTHHTHKHTPSSNALQISADNTFI